MHTDPHLCARIVDAERQFTMDFTDVTARPWGWLYSNREIPDSYDSNHATIADAAILAGPPIVDAILDDIRQFYAVLGITPRLYYVGSDGSGSGFQSLLRDHGWSIYCAPDQWFVRDRPCAIAPAGGLVVERANLASAPLQTIEEADCRRAARVIARRLQGRDYHLLVGRVDGRPVTWASVQQLPDGLVRVDDVYTVTEARGKGYCRGLMRFLVEYQQRNLGGTLYLYAQDPTAIRIYQEAGFSSLPQQAEFWSAWYAPL